MYLLVDEIGFGRVASRADVIAHLLLVHNLRADWARSIDPPMWSVATEWQIYFVFPLVLLPVWRRAGAAAAVAVGFAVGVAPVMFSGGRWFAWASPWYVGLFGLGMAGAAIHSGREKWCLWSRARVPLGGVALAVLAGVGMGHAVSDTRRVATMVVLDGMVGLGSVAFILWLAQGDGRVRVSLTGLLTGRLALWLGSCSYSIYLMHTLAIHSVGPVFRLGDPRTVSELALHATIALPIILLISCIHNRLFERPFLARQVAK